MLEIACFELTSAETALRSVADRIEFCSGIEFGGLTPNIEEFKYLKNKYSKPIYVMIRPKGGVFYYSDEDFLEMKKSIEEFKNNKADGFVFGILKENNEIDVAKNEELLLLAGNIPCSFHRAIDRCENGEKSLEMLIDLGFKTVLTSGGKSSAMEGKENLKNWVEKYSDRIEILIGGGVRSHNIEELKQFTNGTAFHSSAIPQYEIFANENEIKKLKSSI